MEYATCASDERPGSNLFLSVGRNDGIAALMTAAAGGHEKAVELPLAAGADPMALDQEQLTPLMNAAENE